ncbi:hypothetical protein G647_00834 [Cladophialophora carrionii CBS 160.54]|uniref:Calpain catalytic domain-containing protein n=1 Tax=Cladophialophora carrionii CBS 160.54 TaxID=1279043 RepID=V9DNE5_9EURO|nr:uncharacterized protein G647_00834 [Cladophialophora carrionii CBS 160.54]ETI28385.1 hypothetical protein G647_00834 [Cladophialophora carrionii CBS 160.54]
MDDRRDNVGGGGRYYGPIPELNIPPPQPKMRRKIRRQPPQETVNQFWDRMAPRFPGKVFTVLPDNPYARKKAAKTPHGTVSGQRAAKSYEEARAECEKDVNRIIKECRRLNQKYRDLHFDIEWDLKSGQRNCLDGLSTPGDSMKPKGVKRITDIFEKPQFFINGPTAGDVRQGRDGDCYLMAALCGLGNMEGLIDKVCVKHDEDCQAVGVYGFVFFRDGEWQHTIVDDKLYTRAPDYDEAQDERVVWDDINRVDSAEEYRKAHLTGSRALYFAQCSDENETWLPLLEKAYAKAHGDFASIDGGFTGEAIEDLTGGVTTEIYSTDILDRDAFWRDELMQVGQEFLFGCATGFYANWLDTSGAPREREGISEGHAYSIMDAKEVNGERLLKLRNPWGKKEWTGKWSDGSSEWTPEWMQLLDHKFGNDGIFWISYEDLLKKYQHFDRTRIFGPEWTVTQRWTSVSVSWSAEYHSTKFSLTLEEKTRVVIVLAQLDDTYFGGLEGGYGFDLQFRLESDNKEDENDYIVRSNGNYAMARSVSTDIELEAGTYSVLMKITATRHSDREHVEEVLPLYTATRREKLIQMGLSYDLAHAKGVHVETEAERKERKLREKNQRAKVQEKMKQQAKARAEKDWRRQKKEHDLDKKRRARKNHWRQRKNRINGGFEEEIIVERRVERRHERRGTLDSLISEKPDTGIAAINIPDGIVNKGAKERAGPTEEPSGAFQPEAKPTEHISIEKIVEPLEDVIKIADAETQANTADSSSDAQAIQATKPATDAPDEESRPTANAEANGSAVVTDVKPLSNAPPLSRPEHLANGVSVDGGDTGKLGQEERSTHEPLYERPQRSDTLDTTAAMIGIGSGADLTREPEDGDSDGGRIETPHRSGSPSDTAEGPKPDGEEEPASDADSFPPFDWDTELDYYSGPASSDSDDDSLLSSAVVERRTRPRYRPHYIRRVGRGRRSRSPPIGPIPPPGPRDFIEIVEKGGNAHDADDDGPEETWNAVCVVGLRVYSTLKGEGVKLRVVRPSGCSEDEEGPRKGKENQGSSRNGIGDGNGNGHGAAAGKDAILDPDDISKGAVAAEPESTGTVVEGEGQVNVINKGDDLKLGSTREVQWSGTREDNPGRTKGTRSRRERQLPRR